MNWFTELFVNQTFIQAIIVLSLICAVGLLLSKIKFKGVSLGITFVFFAGILAGHFGFEIDPKMLSLAQVGPSFFPSLKKGGLKLNLLAFGVLIFGSLLCMLIPYIFGISFPVSMGLLTGAVTNTPMLGAAQQSLLELNPGSIDLSN